MSKIKYKIVEKPVTSAKSTSPEDYYDRESSGKRWIIVEEGTGKLLDDAQGFGYKSAQAAHKAAWYRFSGGKQRVNAFKKVAAKFWKNNPKLVEDIFYIEFYGLKDGESDKEIEESILEAVKERGIEDFKLEFLKFLP
jgi:hypothetical protein